MKLNKQLNMQLNILRNILNSGSVFFGWIILINLWLASSARATINQTTAAVNPSEELSNYLFKNKNPEVRTDSVIVVRQGRILFEEHRNQVQQLHKVWSISKAITNALIGIAIEERKLRLDSSLCDFYKYLTSDKCRIKIRHLLQWSSGFDWSEDYSVSPETSTVLQMLYGNGAADMAKFVIQQALKFEPGSKWNYSSGDTLLLMGILKKIYGQAYKDLPEARLFRPLGITSAIWEKDASGTLLGASHAFLGVRDLAKFGQLFLNDGLVESKLANVGNGLQRLLPLGWVKFSTQVSQAYYDTYSLAPGSWGQKYPAAAGWWANVNMPNQNKTAPWPSVPADTFAARGFRGQYLFVIPQFKIIIVRLGYDQNDTAFDADQMLKLVKELYSSGNGEGESL